MIGLLVYLILLSALIKDSQSPPQTVVSVHVTLDSLIVDEDTDGDKRITINDSRVPGSDRGDKCFWMTTVEGRKVQVCGTYYLSNLLQELKLAVEAGAETAALHDIFEPPVERISRSIRERFWDGLTRHIDEEGLTKTLADEKAATVDGFHYLYVPHDDSLALSYFSSISARHSDWNLKVIALPPTITGAYVRQLDGHHGLLSLSLVREKDGTIHGAPFVVPGGRFNEMYGWDSYFIVLGLLEDDRIDLAQSMVDNCVYEIEHYGKILNANRTYYLTRSQPPFLTSMARAVYKALPKSREHDRWLGRVLSAAIREYHEVWMNRDRLTDTGLSRYFDSGYGQPPEVEPGAFDVVYAKFAKPYAMDAISFEKAYRTGSLKVPGLDAYFVHDRAMRESGHDTSYRLEGLCADLVTVDLNSLLFKFETDIAEMLDSVYSGALVLSNGNTETSLSWRNRAQKRRSLMTDMLWDESRGSFFDFNIVTGKRTTYVSASCLYPLWAGLATTEQAETMVRTVLPLLEAPGGIVGSTEASRGPVSATHPLRQWDYPYGWAPHQILLWKGLRNYGFVPLAERCAYRWLYTITQNATDYAGTVPEKFDVVRRTHRVYAEYGNVGTTFSYITREGFGWTNASYTIGCRILPPALLDSLNRLIPPEWIIR